MALRRFHENPEYGRSRRELEPEITEVQMETIGRKVGGYDTSDQATREANLTEACSRLN